MKTKKNLVFLVVVVVCFVYRDWQVVFIVYVYVYICVPTLSCKNNMLRKRRNRASASLVSNRE